MSTNSLRDAWRIPEEYDVSWEEEAAANEERTEEEERLLKLKDACFSFVPMGYNDDAALQFSVFASL